MRSDADADAHRWHYCPAGRSAGRMAVDRIGSRRRSHWRNSRLGGWSEAVAAECRGRHLWVEYKLQFNLRLI